MYTIRTMIRQVHEQHMVAPIHDIPFPISFKNNTTNIASCKGLLISVFICISPRATQIVRSYVSKSGKSILFAPLIPAIPMTY